MQHNPYLLTGALVAADLLNISRQRPNGGGPRLTADALNQVLRDHALSDWAGATAEDASRVVGWLDRLRPVFACGSADQQLVLANQLLDGTAVRVVLLAHANTVVHLHFRPDGEVGLPSRLRVLMVLGVAQVICGRTRLGTCHASGCGQVFVDVSRSSRRRYCTALCGNRSAVARHRSRGGATPG